jgi:hypothetical protein
MIPFEYDYVISAPLDSEFLHDVARHEAVAMFGAQGQRWMIWIADRAVILGFADQIDWMNFCARWHSVVEQLLAEGSLT